MTAILLFLSFPPLYLLVPPFVALVPFAVFLYGLPPGGEGTRAALRSGFYMGAVYFGLLVYWIAVALVWFTPMAIPAYLGTVLVLAFLMSAFAWALHRATRVAGAPLWLALPVIWTAAEWFRGHWSDLSFPWLGLGTSLTAYPELVGIAELVGARGVTFWIALVNGLLAVLVLRFRAGTDLRWVALATAGVLVLPPAWGVWRARTLELVPAARVAIVQPNIPEHIKLDRETAVGSTLKVLDALMPQVAPGSVDLVIWPEVTLPDYLVLGQAAADLERVRAHAEAAGAPVLLGALDVEFPEAGGYVPYNAAFVVTPRGLTDFRYAKHFLVPFVERVPFINPRLLGGIEYLGAFGHGRSWPLARAANGATGGVLICYESSFPQASRAYRRAGADFLINITNDAWYGREPWYARTAALWQHPAHMVMRAIEHRVGVARSANTGISMFVDPIGRTYQETRLFEATLRTGTVYTTGVTTLYTRLGDVVGNGSAILTALVLIWVWARSRRAGAAGVIREGNGPS
ncbi:MAG: apolipoprotein N-acyltransferase [Gemmatimonadetes bacterium]|nr:apolipoprotein N-acyltransferase [Gemmatimonadota bacterium]